MAVTSKLPPLPLPQIPIVDRDGRMTKEFAEYLRAIDVLWRGAAGGWREYSPTLTPGAGALTAATASGRFYQIGKIVVVHFNILITTNGTASSYIDVSLPVIPNTAFNNTGAGAEGTTNKALRLKVASDKVRVRYYDGTYPGADGNILDGTFVYEAA